MAVDPAPAAARGGGERRGPVVRGAGRDLRAAIAVGLTLAALFLATLLANPYAFLTFVAVCAVLGMIELDRAFRAQGWRPATPVAVGAGLISLYGAYTNGAAGQSLGLVLLLLGTLAWTLLDADRERVAGSLGATCLMGLWVPGLASFVGLLLARPDGQWVVAAVVALTVTADIGAYAFGSRFGRHRLAPSVSPAKSWEGFAGGLFAVLVLAALLIARLRGFDLVGALVLGVGVTVAATVGDLAESMVKRDLGVKDLGGLLPGHGGIMDRADALLFALPVAHLLLAATGR